MSEEIDASLASKTMDISTFVDQFAKPAPVHVPPRIDPDLYQAEIPDFIPPTEGSCSLFIDDVTNLTWLIVF